MALSDKGHKGHGAPVVTVQLLDEDLLPDLQLHVWPEGQPGLPVLDAGGLEGPEALSILQELRVDGGSGMLPEVPKEPMRIIFRCWRHRSSRRSPRVQGREECEAPNAMLVLPCIACHGSRIKQGL